MNSNKIRAIGAGILVAVWLCLTGFAWFGPKQEMSEAERRPLDQMPEISVENILSGKFMADFEDFTLDQFPLRDTFRQLKALFHYNVLHQGDNNGIYVADGYAAKLEYPMKDTSIQYAVSRFNYLYEKLLKPAGSKVWLTVAPDKGYYLAQENGYPVMDFEEMFTQLQQGMPWAEFVDITDTLSIEDYYRTDTHWRQECLLDAAGKLSAALGIEAPRAEAFTQVAVERPFYGVYYGQAALPMEPETMYYLQSDLLDGCKVFDYETNQYASVYDMSKLESKDLYDIFLSGSKSLLRIENPDAATEKELIVFRDSFGSSMVPLLVQGYSAVTVVDIRYISTEVLDRFVEFKGQDVLLLYSTLVLNNSETIK